MVDRLWCKCGSPCLITVIWLCSHVSVVETLCKCIGKFGYKCTCVPCSLQLALFNWHFTGFVHFEPACFLLQFARENDGSDKQYAIKFFMISDDYTEEEKLYRHSLIRHTLPELILSSDNADGRFKSKNGWPFPPFMVLERGFSLSTCAASCLLVCLASAF